MTQPDDSIVTEENGTTPDVDNTHTATGDDGTVTPQPIGDVPETTGNPGDFGGNDVENA